MASVDLSVYPCTDFCVFTRISNSLQYIARKCVLGIFNNPQKVGRVSFPWKRQGCNCDKKAELTAKDENLSLELMAYWFKISKKVNFFLLMGEEGIVSTQMCLIIHIFFALISTSRAYYCVWVQFNFLKKSLKTSCMIIAILKLGLLPVPK